MNYTPHAYVIWRGPSLVDGAPLVVAVTNANLRSPLVWVLPQDRAPFALPALWCDVIAGRYAHRAPFALPGYAVAHGKRESVPGGVWATLEGRADQ